MKKTIIFLLLSLLFTSSAVANHQWPSMRGTQEGEASMAYKNITTKNNLLNTKIEKWHYTPNTDRKFSLGVTVWTSAALGVVMDRPVVFIGGYDQTLHALDLGLKKEIWAKVTNGIITTAPVVGKVSGQDTVFWGSSDRTVYAHTAYEGKSLWTKELVGASSTLSSARLSSPLLIGDRLFINCFAFDKSLKRNKQQGQLFCLDIHTGEIIFKKDVTSGFLSSPVGFKCDGRQYIVVAAKRGILHCYDVTENEPSLFWHFQMPHEVLGSPVITADTSSPIIFLGSKFGNLIAIDGRTGQERWQRMTGNWIDNAACIGEINGEKIVFVGSHDYQLYAFFAETGKLLWKKELGGEVYSAPTFFTIDAKHYIAASTLDNHLNVLDAKTGQVEKSFFTGSNKFKIIPKGENLWGSPVVFESGEDTAIIHGSFNGTIYIIPVLQETEIESLTYTPKSVWNGILAVVLIFCGIVLPIMIRMPLNQSNKQ